MLGSDTSSSAEAVTSDDTIVGTCYTDKPNRLHLVDAVAINEDGWIAANAVYFDTYDGVLLKPVSR